jgi:separase
MFIYCGHGGGEVACDAYRMRKYSCPAALLWGCSSGHLVVNGVYDPTGLSLAYLVGGSPFLVGNLWDVTDRDLDRLSIECMRVFLNSPGSGSASGKALSAALSSARGVCKMTHAVGSAPVLYGLPLSIS